jgi:hypothetical protein
MSREEDRLVEFGFAVVLTDDFDLVDKANVSHLLVEVFWKALEGATQLPERNEIFLLSWRTLGCLCPTPARSKSQLGLTSRGLDISLGEETS